MKKIIAFILILLSNVAIAAGKEYTLIVPGAPGSGPDFVARTVQATYQRLTGNVLVIENITGGDTIPAINRFKSNNRSLFLGAAAPTVINPLIRDDLPYTDADFNWIGRTSVHPQVWYASKKSGITDMTSLKKYIQAHEITEIAGDSIFNFVNAKGVFDAYNSSKKSLYVRYKGSPDAIMAVSSGLIPVGITAPNPSLIAAEQSGKIKIFATSTQQPLKVGDNLVMPVDASGKIYTLTGWNALAINPQWPDRKEAQELKHDLWIAIIHLDTQDKIAKQGLVSDPLSGDHMLEYIKQSRKSFEKHKDIAKDIAK